MGGGLLGRAGLTSIGVGGGGTGAGAPCGLVGGGTWIPCGLIGLAAGGAGGLAFGRPSLSTSCCMMSAICRIV